MSSSLVYIALSIIVLAVICFFVFFQNKNKKGKSLSRLAGISLLFFVAGLFFSDDRLIGYSLFGAGIIIAVIDMVNKSKGK